MDITKNDLKKWLAYAALNIFGVFIIFLLSDFITPFLGAVMFYILFKKTMNYLTEKKKWKESWSALLIIVLSFIIILIPIMVLSMLLYSKTIEIIADPSSVVNMFKQFDQQIQSLTGIQLLSDENIAGLKAKAGNMIPSFLNQILWTVGNIAMMYFMLYYLLVSRKTVAQEVKNYLPFDEENVEILGKELDSMTLSNAIGVPLICVIQGTAAGIGYWIFGLPEPLFWAVITAFVSLLPLVGSTMIWAPAGIFLLAMGNTWPGLGLLLYGGIVIINIDNVARFMIQKKFADVHPLITVFGVIIGLNLFGLPGLIFGPLMLSYFVLLTRMYRQIYKPGTQSEIIMPGK